MHTQICHFCHFDNIHLHRGVGVFHCGLIVCAWIHVCACAYGSQKSTVGFVPQEQAALFVETGSHPLSSLVNELQGWSCH